MKNIDRIKDLPVNKLRDILLDWVCDADLVNSTDKMSSDMWLLYLKEWRKAGCIIIGRRCILLEKRK